MTDSAEAAKALLEAAKTGNLADIQRLVRAGTSLSRREPNDNSPLFSAAYAGHRDCVLYLLDHGAAIDERNSIGCTALMGAANQVKPACVELLLARGADRTLKGDSGLTAEDFEVKSGNKAVVRIFQDTPAAVTYFHAAGDRTLEEIFSFTMKERITYVRKGEDGPVEAFARESFESLAGTEGLHRAFAEHARRGGAQREEDLGTGNLGKARLLRREP